MIVNIDTPIIVAFANEIQYFTDKFTGKGLIAIYGCSNVEELLSLMEHLIEYPDGMWYWVLHNEKCVCSGACDPGDIEIFKEYFNVTN